MSRISKIEQRVAVLEKANHRRCVLNYESRIEQLEKVTECVKNGCHDFGDRHTIFDPSYHGDKPLPVNRQTCQRCGFVKDSPISEEFFKKLTK